MFSILDFPDTTPEQVEQAVKDGLIHPFSAKVWLAKRPPAPPKRGKLVLRDLLKNPFLYIP